MKALYARDRQEWRAWLAKNSRSAEGVWLLYYKKGSGKRRLSYDDAVREALCFGWIDGKIKAVDASRYAQWFTPRNPRSRWSALNVRRVKSLIQEGLMAAQGLKAFQSHEVRRAEPLPRFLPDDLKEEFMRHAAAWKNFNRFPPSHRRLVIGWVASAKKQETRRKRLRRAIEAAAESRRIKFM